MPSTEDVIKYRVNICEIEGKELEN
jgi:hypothetical protein